MQEVSKQLEAGDVYLLTLFLCSFLHPWISSALKTFQKSLRWGPDSGARKGMQEKSKQLLQSQQQVLAPKLMDLFSFEELERKEEDQCWRKATLLQWDLWSTADPKQAPALQGLLQITQELGLQIYLPFIDTSNGVIPWTKAHL